MTLVYDLAVAPRLDARACEALRRTVELVAETRARVLIVRQATAWSLAARAQTGGAEPNALETVQSFARLLAALRACPLPTLAVAEGRMSDASVGVLAACDLVLAARGATFEAPRGDHGVPRWALLSALRRRVDPARLHRWSDSERVAAVRWATSARLVDDPIVGPAITARTASWARALSAAPRDELAYLRHRFDNRTSGAQATASSAARLPRVLATTTLS